MSQRESAQDLVEELLELRVHRILVLELLLHEPAVHLDVAGLVHHLRRAVHACPRTTAPLSTICAVASSAPCSPWRNWQSCQVIASWRSFSLLAVWSSLSQIGRAVDPDGRRRARARTRGRRRPTSRAARSRSTGRASRSRRGASSRRPRRVVLPVVRDVSGGRRIELRWPAPGWRCSRVMTSLPWRRLGFRRRWSRRGTRGKTRESSAASLVVAEVEGTPERVSPKRTHRSRSC